MTLRLSVNVVLRSSSGRPGLRQRNAYCVREFEVLGGVFVNDDGGSSSDCQPGRYHLGPPPLYKVRRG